MSQRKKIAKKTSTGDENAQVELERLRKENAALKAERETKIKLKVSQKGGVSFYGLGRWPTTLYLEQWETLLDHKEQILAFIEEHRSELKTRDSE